MKKDKRFIGLLLLAAACRSTPENASVQQADSLQAVTVDTSAAAHSGPVSAAASGKLSGSLCYPSDYLPAMTVYAREIHSGKTHSLKTQQNQKYFTFENLPFGAYQVYAYTLESLRGDGSKGSGAYTQMVPCGLTVACQDHTLIAVQVSKALQQDSVQVCDWYGALIPQENRTSSR